MFKIAEQESPCLAMPVIHVRSNRPGFLPTATGPGSQEWLLRMAAVSCLIQNSCTFSYNSAVSGQQTAKWFSVLALVAPILWKCFQNLMVSAVC